MGAEESTMPLQPVPPNFPYMCVVFKIPDNIRIIHGTEAEHSIIWHVIKNTWKEGIQETKRKCAGSVLCFKLNGLPFETGILAMNIREVACQILQHLNNTGWKLIVSTNLTKCREWFTLIFVRKKTQRIIQNLAYVALSSNDKFHFWNLQQHVLDEISHIIHSQYQPGVSFQETTDGGKSYEVLLNGSPWSSSTSSHAEARAIVLKVFSALVKKYQFLCAMNVKRTEDTFVFVPKPLQANSVEEVFIITLRKTQKIQVFKAPDELIPVIHAALVEAYGKTSHAINKTIDHTSGKIEFKYKSHTLKDPGAQCAMTKFIVCKLLEALKAHGWSVMTGFDMSRGLSNKSELLFHRSTPQPDCKVFCLSPVCKSKLCVINAPLRIINVCRTVISRRWHLPLISETQFDDEATCVAFELGGKPWSDSGEFAYFTHSMLCHLLEEFSHKGFKINLTADVLPESVEYNEGTSFPHDPNAWWFMHKPTVASPSAPDTPDNKLEMEAVPPLADVLSGDYREPPVTDSLLTLDDSQPFEPPPSYEMVMGQTDLERK